MDKNIKIELNVEDTNLVLSALSELPFKVSQGLITKISNQANSQLQTEKTEVVAKPKGAK